MRLLLLAAGFVVLSRTGSLPLAAATWLGALLLGPISRRMAGQARFAGPALDFAARALGRALAPLVRPWTLARLIALEAILVVSGILFYRWAMPGGGVPVDAGFPWSACHRFLQGQPDTLPELLLLPARIQADGRFVHVLTGSLALLGAQCLSLAALLLARLAGRGASRTPDVSRSKPPYRLGFEKKMLFSAVVCVALLLPAIPFLRWNHERLVRELPGYDRLAGPSAPKPVFPRLEPLEAVNLGWVHWSGIPLPSSYTRFEPLKSPGVVRIGMFGDSFTFGDEVSPGFDVASLLQEKFRRSGYENVEVINFGMSAYGEHQAYLMWESLGKHYDLDTVIFTPFLSHEIRDRTFVFRREQYNPPHARYVLAKEGLRLVPVAGSTRAEAAAFYYSFLPPWRYLRFDHELPIALWEPLGWMRGIRNPLYYRGADGNEIRETYVRLFRGLAAEAKNLVVVCFDAGTYALRAEVAGGSSFLLSRTKDYLWSRFLYRAPAGHPSAMGNLIRAEELFSFLTGEKRPGMTLVETAPLDPESAPGEGPARPLYEGVQVLAGVGPSVAGVFGTQTKSGLPGWFGEDLDFAKARIAALAFVEAPDPLFIPSGFLLKDAAPVTARFLRAGVPVEIRLGTIRCASSGVVGRIVLESTVFHGDGWLMTLASNLRRLHLDSTGRIRDVSVWVGDHELLREHGGGKGPLDAAVRGALSTRRTVEIKPLTADFAGIRARSGQFVDVGEGEAREATVDLAVRDSAGVESRYPVLALRPSSEEPEGFAPRYDRPIPPPK